MSDAKIIAAITIPAVMLLGVGILFVTHRQHERPLPESGSPTRQIIVTPQPSAPQQASAAPVQSVTKPSKTAEPLTKPRTSPLPVVDKPVVYGRVSGAAWSVKNDGTSNLLRGMPVVILNRESTDLAPLIAFLSEQKPAWTKLASQWQDMAADNVERRKQYPDSPFFGDDYKKEIAENTAKAAETQKMIGSLSGVAKIDRLLEFQLQKRFNCSNILAMDSSGTEVASGKTNVDGKFSISNIPAGDYYLVSFFGTSSFMIDWMIPIHVDSNQEISIDLYNDNALYIHNAH